MLPHVKARFIEKGWAEVRVGIRGIEALLPNPMTEEQLMAMFMGVPGPDKKTKYRDFTAQQVVDDIMTALTRDGVVGLPDAYLEGCLREAGRYEKLKGRQMVSTATSTKLFSLLRIVDEFIPLANGTPGSKPTWRWDMKRGVGKNSPGKPAVGILRPRLDSWSLEFTILVNVTRFNLNSAQALIERGGTDVGLCDFRPDTKGKYGQFEIASWDVISAGKVEKPAKDAKKKGKGETEPDADGDGGDDHDGDDVEDGEGNDTAS